MIYEEETEVPEEEGSEDEIQIISVVTAAQKTKSENDKNVEDENPVKNNAETGNNSEETPAHKLVLDNLVKLLDHEGEIETAHAEFRAVDNSADKLSREVRN